MSMTIDPPGRPRRGRPPARNEILQAGRLASLDPRDRVHGFGKIADDLSRFRAITMQ